MCIQRIAVVTVVLLLIGAVAPAVAAGSGDAVDECQSADSGPTGDAGPPGFVSGLVGSFAGFLGDLFASLPVPNFVRGFFGAPTC